jgi:L-lactate dehydrogenase complex protein LldF
MASVGIEVLETDLGERIQPLDIVISYVVVPAVHKLRRDAAEVFSHRVGTEPDNNAILWRKRSGRQPAR